MAASERRDRCAIVKGQPQSEGIEEEVDDDCIVTTAHTGSAMKGA